MAKDPKPRTRLTYEWYVFVTKSGSVERCIGTMLHEADMLLQVSDQSSVTFSVKPSEIVDHWKQERRVTKAGEERIQEALRKRSAPENVRQ